MDQEKQQLIRRHHGQLRRNRSVWIGWLVHSQRIGQRIRERKYRTLQGRRARNFQEHLRTTTERIRKNITRNFKNHGLKITIQTNLKIVNYLDVTFNLTNGSYYPYRKPNNLPQYINIKSNHPPNIIKQLPASINRRISDNSCNEHEFNKAKPIYDDALKIQRLHRNARLQQTQTSCTTKT